MTTAAELTGATVPTPEGFRIVPHRPQRITPQQWYEGLMILCGLKHTAPAPHEVEAVQVESRGTTVHVEMILCDGRFAVVDVPLDLGVRGLL